MSAKKFALFYILYLVLVSTSVTQNTTSPKPVLEFSNYKIAVIWPWLNPYSGVKAGDYLWMKVDPGTYWEYVYPLALEEVKWLKAHNFTAIGLVYSPDREDLYEYVPWLFAIAEEKMGFVWVLVSPRNRSDYVKGWASYPPSANLSELLQRVYKLTPLYINSKIRVVNELLNNTIILSVCPLPYPHQRDKAIVFVYGNIPKIVSKNIVLIKLPKNSTFVNDFYTGRVLWGTPITVGKGR
jgi:hypothetical protein